MIQQLDKTRQLNALLKYTSARLIMKEELERLKDDVAWTTIMASNLGTQAQTSWTLNKLIAYTSKESFSECGKVEQKGVAPGPKTNSLPSAPTNLTITTTRRIESLHRVADALAELGNGETLTLARRYSARAVRTIFEWEVLRTRLLNETLSRDNSKIIDAPSEVSAAADVGKNGSRDEQIKKFTLRFTLPQLVQLAGFAPPTLSEAEALMKDQGNVTLPSVGVPIGLTYGTTIVEVSMLVSFVYFWLYYGEARCSPRFPAQATLFGVFARTRLKRILFLSLPTLPPIAAAALAMNSFWVNSPWIRYGNTLLAALVAAVALLIWLEGRLPSIGDASDADFD